MRQKIAKGLGRMIQFLEVHDRKASGGGVGVAHLASDKAWTFMWENWLVGSMERLESKV